MRQVRHGGVQVVDVGPRLEVEVTGNPVRKHSLDAVDKAKKGEV
jgi:hypothetical protein